MPVTTGFAAHMRQQMVLVAVVSPVVAAALGGGRSDPVRHPRLFAAHPASLFELAVTRDPLAQEMRA